HERIGFTGQHEAGVRVALLVVSLVPVWIFWSLTPIVARARRGERFEIPPDIRPTLICNLQGRPFTETGFRSNWHRLMRKAVALGAIVEPFTFHDLRAKSASDALDPQEATERLGHDDPRTTRAVYMRKPRRAPPGKKY